MKTRYSFKSLAIFVLAIAQLMLALDYTIIYVTLPSIGQDLHFTASSLQWVVSAYSLIFGGFLLIGGRMSDVLGRRRMFMIAMALFGLGSLAGGFAPNGMTLILARGLQGLGGALLSPATLSLIMSNFEEGPERNRALGIWSTMGGVGMSLGLLLGGFLTSYSGWAATFYVNVPVAVIVLILTPFVLAESRISSSQQRHFDLSGAISVTAGMILVVYYLIQGPEEGWTAASTLIPGIAGVILLVLFAIIERRTANPLMPFKLLKNRSFSGAVMTAVIFSASFGSLYYFLTIYLQQVLHYTAIQSGLSFLPLTISAFLGAKLVNRLLGATGMAGTIGTGMALGAAGFLLLMPISANGSFWGIMPGIILAGLGQAIVFTTMFIAAGTGMEPAYQGVASALVSTGQQIGGSIGLAVILAVITAGLGPGHGMDAGSPADLNHALHWAFGMNMVLALAGIVVSVVWFNKRRASSPAASIQMNER
ncbi:MFS transporter [Paenibacillus cellulositrophicus]|uniref:MFS transporter n=1 Tax=Paenibacillus cellulositrophicus TaxID=562959 RepID=UPI003F821506